MSSTAEPGESSNRPAVRSRRLVWWPRSAKRRIAFFSIYGVFLYVLGRLGIQSFWMFHAGVPPYEKPTIWDAYYRELRLSGVTTADLRPSDGHFDVLLLGASVLVSPFGTINPEIENLLVDRLRGRGRVWNLAVTGHTSRDSLVKYQRLSKKHFDLVLYYDAINDVRMNNCPADEFQEDYTHSDRYASFERLRRQTDLPFADLRRQAEFFNDLVSAEELANLREYGGEMKTPPVYRRNLEQIVELTRIRGGRIALISFASHIPQDYTRADFDAKRIDYAYRDDGRSCPVELWGEQENVRNTLAAHNRELRDLAKQHPEALYVDMAEAIPPTSENFTDPCHLTEAGCRRFVETLRPILEQEIKNWERRQ